MIPLTLPLHRQLRNCLRDAPASAIQPVDADSPLHRHRNLHCTSPSAKAHPSQQTLGQSADRVGRPRQIIGVVVYAFVGQYVSSPALGSAGILMKRICYGLAMPGLLITAILFTHVCPYPTNFLESSELPR